MIYFKDIIFDLVMLDFYMVVLGELIGQWNLGLGWIGWMMKKDSLLYCIWYVKDYLGIYKGQYNFIDECIDNYINKLLWYGVFFRVFIDSEFNCLWVFLVEQLVVEEFVVCGDGICFFGNEDLIICYKDCGVKCGDNKCVGYEINESCLG